MIFSAVDLPPNPIARATPAIRIVILSWNIDGSTQSFSRDGIAVDTMIDMYARFDRNL